MSYEEGNTLNTCSHLLLHTTYYNGLIGEHLRNPTIRANGNTATSERLGSKYLD